MAVAARLGRVVNAALGAQRGGKRATAATVSGYEVSSTTPDAEEALRGRCSAPASRCTETSRTTIARCPTVATRCRPRAATSRVARPRCSKLASSPRSSRGARNTGGCGHGEAAKIRRFGPARRWAGLDRAEDRKGGRLHHDGRRRGTPSAGGRDCAEVESTRKAARGARWCG